MFFLSSIIGTVADFFNCTQLYDDFFLTNFLLEKCNDNPKYEFWKINLIFPTFLIFIVAFPLLLFFYMYRNRNRLFDSDVVYKIGFLLNGYSEKSYYW